jgi:hypothetical protein
VVVTTPKQIGSAKPGQVLDAVSGELLVFGGVDAHANTHTVAVVDQRANIAPKSISGSIMIQSLSLFGPAMWPSRLIAAEYTTLRMRLLRSPATMSDSVRSMSTWPRMHRRRHRRSRLSPGLQPLLISRFIPTCGGWLRADIDALAVS